MQIVFEIALSVKKKQQQMYGSAAVYIQPPEITRSQQYFKSSLQGSYLTLML